MSEPHALTSSLPPFLSYEEKWEHLKPTILHLFLEKKLTVPDLVKRMKKEYNFSAQPSHYKYQLKKWGAKKRTTTDEKEAIVSVLGKRMRAGMSTDDVSISNPDGSLVKKVDKKQLMRFLKEKSRDHQHLSILPGIFAQWNLPYASLMAARRQTSEMYHSPFGQGPETPSYLTVTSPDAAPSPGTSCLDPSPATELVRRSVLTERSMLFLGGRQQELLSGLTASDRRLVSTFLHDFWIHSYVTAKYWGKGPESWSAAMIEFKTLGVPDTVPSPQTGTDAVASPRDVALSQCRLIIPPAQLCDWSIHVEYTEYEAFPDANEPIFSPRDYDIEDESTWPEWRYTADRPGLEENMADALQSNTFTDISAQEVPLSASTIVKASQSSPRGLLIDALAFAIMAGNRDSLQKILDKIEDKSSFETIKSQIKPLHLAISYMNAARNCCGLIRDISDFFYHSDSQTFYATDENGHTILDAFFLNILRSHTNVVPDQVNERLARSGRFPGEEKDICGRWDLDSPCVRRLLVSGTCRIPFAWKHVFCHTSVQGICHGISQIAYESKKYSREPVSHGFRSGLFSRVCGSCSQRLELGPLHSLVLVAFHLAESGRPGETLFGILACLLTLLVAGNNPLLKVEISVKALIQNQNCEHCDHTRMDAAELIWQVPQHLVASWPEEVQLGWRVFVQLLHHAKLAEQVHIRHRVRDEDEDKDESESEEFATYKGDSEWPRLETGLACEYCEDCWSLKSSYFTTIWGAVLAEMLTYRRLTENDPWLSPNFSMQAIIDWLDGETTNLNMPFFTRDMINVPDCPVIYSLECADYICKEHFMNMEDWGRTSFVQDWSEV